MQGTHGIWVKNVGVQIVSGDCILGNCGYFDGQSYLSIPFFKGNYRKNGFSVSFFFKAQAPFARAMALAMISNDCPSDAYSDSTENLRGSLSIIHVLRSVVTEVEQEDRKVASINVTVRIASRLSRSSEIH